MAAPPSLTRPPASSPDPAIVPAVLTASTSPDPIWTTTGGERFVPRQVLRLSSLITVRDAVRAGAGAGLLPGSMLGDDLKSGRLVSWGTSDQPPTEAWVLHTSRRLVSAKVRAFVDFLSDAFPEGRLI